MDTKKLRQKILDLAIHGKLVPQDPNDEPASVLLERIREEKDRLIKEGKIKKTKSTASSDTSHYENVPFEVPEKWIWVNLDSICSKIVDGDHNPPPGEVSPTNYRMLSSKNINNNKLVDIEDCRYLSKQDWELCNSRTRLHKGDILLTTVATLGRSCVIETDEPICFQRSVTILTTLIYNKYLKLVFDSNYYQELMTDSAKGTAQKGFYINQVVQSVIPLPPLAEQKRIVTAIEKWMSIIDSMETNRMNILESIKQAKNSILDLAIHGKLVSQDASDEPASELLKRINPKAVSSCDNPHYENVPFEIPVNWVWVKVCDIAQSNIGLTYKPSDISQDGVPVMRSNNIQNGVLCNDDIVRVNTKLLDSQVLNNGDLLICARNGSKNLVGKCALVNNIQETTSFGAFMAVCRSNMNNWLYHVLSSEYFKNYLDDSNSTTIHQVTQKMLLAFDIPLPPLREQKRICSKIKELYNTIDDITDALS